MREIFGSDCYSSKEIAEQGENGGVTKGTCPCCRWQCSKCWRCGLFQCCPGRLDLDDAVQSAKWIGCKFVRHRVVLPVAIDDEAVFIMARFEQKISVT